MMIASCLFLLLAISSCLSVPMKVEDKCGYDSCTQHEPDLLNIHIVAHTHDDVGWLKTVDQYYYGSRNSIQKAGVQYIIDSVVKELWEDPKRRFIYVETAFFWKWWVRQSSETQDRVHALVRQGRLQFVGGAWSMNDEAAAHYQSTIDQFTHGLKRLNETFGQCGIPTIGWQIDPFGHSREFASLLAGMGYDGLFLGRIDYQDKESRAKHKTMEMIWRGDDDLGHSSDIFTSVLYNQYQPPPGFCFDILCDDEPIIDDPNSPMFNVDEKVSKFLKFVEQARNFYISNNILITMGGDFTYQDAGMWYTNLDKLIEYTNLKAGKDGLRIKAFYSTPGCYLKAVKDANPTLPIKTDDFFPYASDPTAYWTGYFTSRPTTKYLERQTNTLLQMVKQLQVLANLERHYNFVVDSLRAAMGVMQHHDAVTGTEKQHVARDYVRLVAAAAADNRATINHAMGKLSGLNKLPIYDQTNPLIFKECALNETSCEISQKSDQFIVSLYNTLAWSRNYILRIPVDSDESKITYTVTDHTGEDVKSFVQPVFEGFKNVFNQSEPADFELVFVASLPALGYSNYYVSKHMKDALNINQKREAKPSDYYDGFNDYIKQLSNRVDEIDNEFKHKGKKAHNSKYFEKPVSDLKHGPLSPKYGEDFNIDEVRMLSDDPAIIERFDEEDATSILRNTNLDATRHKDDKYVVKHSMKYYPACAGSNKEYSKRSSGAYIFRPNATEPKPLNIETKVHRENAIGKEYMNKLSNNVSYIVRINDNNVIPYHEIEFMIGPIDVEDGVGKEFVVIHEMDISNNKVFYTDASGRQVIKRVKDYRPTWNVSLQEPVPGNYYPVVNKISVADDKVKLTVLTDRSVGATSMNEGQIEIMVHRRLLHDDDFGVGEALNETLNGNGLIVRGIHKFMITDNVAHNIDEADSIRKAELSAEYDPVVTFADASDLAIDEWKKLQNSFTGLKKIPKGINVLTLEQWDDNNLLLLRLENILSTDIGLPQDTLTAKVKLTEIFKDITIKSVQETLLAANRIDLHEPWQWNTNGKRDRNQYVTVNDQSENDGVLTFAPRQIRTFIVEYDVKKRT